MAECDIYPLPNGNYAIDWTSSGGTFVTVSPDNFTALIDAIVAARADWIRN
jgi:hypothetical protein